MSGITVGAVDAAVGNGIGIFGEAAYAPIVTAKLDKEELKDSSMMALRPVASMISASSALRLVIGIRVSRSSRRRKSDSLPSLASLFGIASTSKPGLSCLVERIIKGASGHPSFHIIELQGAPMRALFLGSRRQTKIQMLA